MKKLNAGDLRHRVAFDKKGSASDGYGGRDTAFTQQFVVPAQFIHLRGGENVMAARLEGRHSQIVRVRTSEQTKTITTEWRARDTRLSQAFAIQEIVLSDDGSYIDLLCERGIAA